MAFQVGAEKGAWAGADIEKELKGERGKLKDGDTEEGIGKSGRERMNSEAGKPGEDA
jgi:hypothetical protein